MKLLNKISEWFYPGIETIGLSPIDGTIQFYSKINYLIKANSIALDYGAGRGAQLECDAWKQQLLLLQPKCTTRIGCDVDPVVFGNPYIDKAVLLDKTENFRIPLDDQSVDVVLADWVIEHLPDPFSAFNDIHRVLKKGGWFFARTGNLWHYSYALAKILGEKIVSEKIIAHIQPEREERDVFVKFFRANTSHSLKKLCRRARFSRTYIHGWEPEPGYLKINSGIYALGALYQRAASIGLLPRATLLLYSQK
jgi:SAM-dependent methyltransferase